MYFHYKGRFNPYKHWLDRCKTQNTFIVIKYVIYNLCKINVFLKIQRSTPINIGYNQRLYMLRKYHTGKKVKPPIMANYK